MRKRIGQLAIGSSLLVFVLGGCDSPGVEGEGLGLASTQAPYSFDEGSSHEGSLLWDFLDNEPAAQPLLVNAKTDCGYHGYATESWWFFSKLESVRPRGHEIYALAHVLYVTSPAPAVLSTTSFYDKTTDTWLQQEAPADPSQVSIAPDRLSAVTPTISIVEREQDIAITSVLGNSSSELYTKPVRHVVYNAGGGAWPWLGGPNYQIGFPEMKTKGTITIEGVEYEVRGTTWYDRQYGDSDTMKVIEGSVNWTWFGIQLDQMDVAISAWQYNDFDAGTTNTFATIRGPDGTHTVAPMTLTGSSVWESPVTQQKYPTEYVIEIPSMKTRLAVEVARDDQEIVSAMPRNQGAGYAWGRYNRRHVTGHATLEMVGNFM